MLVRELLQIDRSDFDKLADINGDPVYWAWHEDCESVKIWPHMTSDDRLFIVSASDRGRD